MQVQQEPVVNENEIRIVGMSRSGNHAIIQWLVRQMAQTPRGARVCWLNCPEPRWNPYWTTRPFDDGSCAWTSYPGFDLEEEKACRFTRKDWFVFNYEDTFLRVARSPEYEREHDAWVGRSAVRRDVLILRDPFNLFASRLRSLEPVVDHRTAIRIWKQHARQFLGARERRSPLMLPHDPVLILYNRWCDDAAYRRGVCDALGVRFTDAGVNRVVAAHGGSSFDGLRYDGRATEMRTAERWRHFIDDPDYRALFDGEVLRLAEQVFGRLPAAEALARRRTMPRPRVRDAALPEPAETLVPH